MMDSIIPPRIIQASFSYIDGFGREIQTKIPAEPEEDSIDPRWVGSGWTVFNNKGKPVRKYEPFFADKELGHRFEFDNKVGVSPTIFYDPLDRVVVTLHPNKTYEKALFSPWEQFTFDVNDTVMSHPQVDKDILGYVSKYFAGEDNFKTWYEERINSPAGPQQDAALKSAKHNGTPAATYFDTLGRTVVAFADNGGDEKYKTTLELDIEGNQRAVKDAMGRTVMVYDYDILGNRVKQSVMDAVRTAGQEDSPAGVRWFLDDVVGKPIYKWDSRGHIFHTSYNDRLHRPIEVLFQEKIDQTPKRVQHITYGETKGANLNHRGKVYEHQDGAGVLTNEAYDFKGNLLKTSRKFASDYKNILNWSSPVQLEEETFTTSVKFDALNRPIKQIAPDDSIIHFIYNESNMLERVEAKIPDADEFKPIVKKINYNARGQRVLVLYGNNVQTSFEFDNLTFRLTHLLTTRVAEKLQDLSYTYDPVGNIVHIEDNADIQKIVFFQGQRVQPSADYIYYPVYWLKEAVGREYLGIVNGLNNGGLRPPEPTSPTDEPRVNVTNASNALGIYLEKYEYDAVGNIKSIDHTGADPSNPGWKRCFFYEEKSTLEPGLINNCLSRTLVGKDCVTGETYLYAHDVHGNMNSMPHLSHMEWDYRDQLYRTSTQKVNEDKTPISTFYVYDATGKRVRKVTEGEGDVGQIPKRAKERLYLAGFEIYREFKGDGQTIKKERQTLHLMDNSQRIALVETLTKGDDNSLPQSIRFQLSNHLGSASLELDQDGQIISYEEYYPFGCTSYQAGRNITEVNLKRYRYTAKERDEETGFYYHGSRYYAPWIGRWISCDPMGLIDGLNLYTFVRNDPIKLIDPNGTDAQEEGAESAEHKHIKQTKVGRAVHPPGSKLQSFRRKHLPSTSNKPDKANDDSDSHGPNTEPHSAPAKQVAGGTGENNPGGVKATQLDKAAELAGKFNFQSTSKEGVSGGIPGGMDPTASGNPLVQMLYVAVTAWGVINMAKVAWNIVKAAASAVSQGLKYTLGVQIAGRIAGDRALREAAKATEEGVQSAAQSGSNSLAGG